MQELLQHGEEVLRVKIGYARVSTQDQKLDLQMKSLKMAGCQKIFREKVSGFNRQRPEFQRMLDQIRPGDIIVVWKLGPVGQICAGSAEHDGSDQRGGR
jgi:DNA invertase Pin-like site-specific DNA recombinase